MQHLETLSAILRTGSFEDAASQLHVTPSAVSQRIKSLEDRIGAPLIQRGQPCRPTAIGAKLLRHADTVASLERHLFAELGATHSPAVPMRVAVTADSLATWVLPALAEVEDVLFDLVIDDQDHSEHWLRRGEVAGALTARIKAVQGCAAYHLGQLRYLAVASPRYRKDWFPAGLTRDAASRAPILQFNTKDALQHRWLAARLGERITPPAHFLASSQGFVKAAELGLGWGMVPEALAHDGLQAGRLELISPEPLDIPVVWQVTRAGGAAAGALTKALRRASKSALRQVTAA